MIMQFHKLPTPDRKNTPQVACPVFTKNEKN